MSHDRNPSDRDIEKLLQGNDVDPELLAVAEWTAAVRVAAVITVGSATAAEHVAAAAQAAAARVRVGQALGTVRGRSSLVFGRFYRSFAARVAVIASALVLATTGVAAAGVLPDSVQEPIADVYGIVGFDFHPDDDDDGAIGDVDDEDGDEVNEDGQLGVTEEGVTEEDVEEGDLDDYEEGDLDDDEEGDLDDYEEGDLDDDEQADLDDDEEGDLDDEEEDDSDSDDDDGEDDSDDDEEDD